MRRVQIAVAAGVAPCLPGMLSALGLSSAPAPPLFAALYDAAWFVGAGASTAVYSALMLLPPLRALLLGTTAGGGGGGDAGLSGGSGGAPAPA